MLKNTIQKGRRKEGQGFVAFLWKKKKKKEFLQVPGFYTEFGVVVGIMFLRF